MARPSKRTLKRYAEPLAYDPNPLYAVKVDSDGHLHHWMAFDPRYGPEAERQITYHIDNGTPGAELWEVGQPSAPYA